MKITQYSASPNHKNEFKILNQLQVPDSIDDYHLTAEEKRLIAQVVGAPDNTVQGGGSRSQRKTRKIRRVL